MTMITMNGDIINIEEGLTYEEYKEMIFTDND